MGWSALLAVAALLAAPVWATDPYCPAYPRSERDADTYRIDLERKLAGFSALARSKTQSLSSPPRRAQASVNFIDDYIFGKMAADGVNAAPPTNDAEFLRRVSVDLIGRIPAPDQVTQFLANNSPNKREALVDSLMASDAFLDYWTQHFANRFEVTSGYYNLIGIPGRQLFHDYLRDFIARDRSYADVATELLTATGDSHQSGPPNFLIRGWQQGDPIQDTWDTITDRITMRFLGVKSECVSCHNGAAHLEPINLYLSKRKRQEFWRQSAFLSRMNIDFMLVDAFFQAQHAIIADRSTGAYTGVVSSSNPGPRPARTGGPYTPVYMFTGEVPRSGKYRQELARMVVADRQFARTAVNYLWAHFFTVGIVDPPDAWDLARIDPRNPPPAPWTLQPSNPALIEALADAFLRSDFSVRQMIRLMAVSNAYQLSSRYPAGWKPEHERYFAKHIPRRLSPEEMYDSVITATKTETPMFVDGFDQPLMYASQLPDPTEPRSHGQIRNFLTNFGRGDWWTNAYNLKTNVLEVLFLMNDNNVNFRTFGSRGSDTMITGLLDAKMTDQDTVTRLFLATLSRLPSDQEMKTALSKKTNNYEQWLTDLQWALLNKLDFIFNY